MAYRAVHVSDDPLEYFKQKSDEGPYLRVSDVILRENKNPKEVFSRLIRIATNSKWSHSALLYLLADPEKGYDNTFLVEATTKGVRVASWRNEVEPSNEFTVGIKRLNIDWYVESPAEQRSHDPNDPEDTHGIGYLRHVRGIALDQINNLYDHKVVWELAGLYAERVAKRHLPGIPQVAHAAAEVADLFKKWDDESSNKEHIFRFICSGLVQYSFFAALRIRIINDMKVPERRDAAMSNLQNMHKIIFRDDPDHVISEYIEQVKSGKLDIAAPVPDGVLDLLKTATPADFNNSPNLKWRYVIQQGAIWRIEQAPEGYTPQSEEESKALMLLSPEHHSSDSE
jgi:hypothetical protein